MLGKLSWAAIPFNQPIPLVAGSMVIVVVLAVIAWIVLKGHRSYLWRESITSVAHKRIQDIVDAAIVSLLLLGSLWIMANLHHNLAPTEESMKTELARIPDVPAVTAMGVVRPAATEPVSAPISGGPRRGIRRVRFRRSSPRGLKRGGPMAFSGFS